MKYFPLLTGLFSILISVLAPVGAPLAAHIMALGFAFLCFLAFFALREGDYPPPNQLRQLDLDRARARSRNRF